MKKQYRDKSARNEYFNVERNRRQKGDQYITQITEFVPIDEMLNMYSPYHETDIRQFCDKIWALYSERKSQTNLKRRRIAAGLSQSQLAALTGIPVRTIQQYEQGQKDIGKARAVILVFYNCMTNSIQILIIDELF